MFIQRRIKVNSESHCFGVFSLFSTPAAHYGLGHPLKSKMMTVWLEAMQWTTSHRNTLPPLKKYCQPISLLKCMWKPPLSLLPLTTGHEPMEHRDLPSPSCLWGTWCLGAWTGACSTWTNGWPSPLSGHQTDTASTLPDRGDPWQEFIYRETWLRVWGFGGFRERVERGVAGSCGSLVQIARKTLPGRHNHNPFHSIKGYFQVSFYYFCKGKKECT